MISVISFNTEARGLHCWWWDQIQDYDIAFALL